MRRVYLTERLFEPHLPSPIRKVLFVCKGNICRSPMGEVYFRRKARELGLQLTVQSAGLDTTSGRAAHPYAIEAIQRHGMTLANHATQSLHRDLAEQADLIIVMEVAQRAWLTRLYPQARGKVFVAGRFGRLDSLDIADPFSGTPKEFQVCFEAIRECCDGLLNRYVKRHHVAEEGVLRDAS
ncbi:MAG: low molecular weight phosphotyrosine protein phosphatase [Nitrospira defluvii]|nr:low molecular weight phosphotyrosine protein phosphatase [Nitrospira defluvii]